MKRVFNSHRQNTFIIHLVVAFCGSAGGQRQPVIHVVEPIPENCSTGFSPRHCGDVLRVGQTATGVYTLFHEAAGPSGQEAYCDMDTDSGGWTVIQRRGQFGNNVYYFHKSWAEYAQGFGDLTKEFWIGNRALHALTSGQEAMKLRVELTKGTNDSQSVYYGSIHVGSENDKFQLKLGSFRGPEGWNGMSILDGNNFSTFDNDNYRSESNCASLHGGAWWYGNCFETNLNGLNLNGHHDSYGNGIVWAPDNVVLQLDSLQYSYPSVRMMIKPVYY